jgi:hypothetical protein
MDDDERQGQTAPEAEEPSEEVESQELDEEELDDASGGAYTPPANYPGV